MTKRMLADLRRNGRITINFDELSIRENNALLIRKFKRASPPGTPPLTRNMLVGIIPQISPIALKHKFHSQKCKWKIGDIEIIIDFSDYVEINGEGNNNIDQNITGLGAIYGEDRESYILFELPTPLDWTVEDMANLIHGLPAMAKHWREENDKLCRVWEAVKKEQALDNIAFEALIRRGLEQKGLPMWKKRTSDSPNWTQYWHQEDGHRYFIHWVEYPFYPALKASRAFFRIFKRLKQITRLLGTGFTILFLNVDEIDILEKMLKGKADKLRKSLPEYEIQLDQEKVNGKSFYIDFSKENWLYPFSVFCENTESPILRDVPRLKKALNIYEEILEISNKWDVIVEVLK